MAPVAHVALAVTSRSNPSWSMERKRVEIKSYEALDYCEPVDVKPGGNA